MSAHKRTTVTMSEEQYRQMHEAAMKKRFLEKEIPEIRKQLKKETQNDLKNTLKQVEKREQAYLELIDDMQADFQQSELDTAQILKERDSRLWQALDTYAGELWNETTSQILQERDEIYQSIQEEHRKQQKQMIAITDVLSFVEQDGQGKYQAVLAEISQVEEFIQHLQENYPQEVNQSSEFAHCERQLYQAETHLEQGFIETGFTFSQQALSSLTDLRIKFENHRSEQETLVLAVIEKARELQYLIERNQTCQAVDLEGNEIDYQIRIDDWTEDSLQKKLDYLADLLNQLIHYKDLIEIKFLKELLKETLPELQADFEENIHTARRMVLNAQIRVNIADLVLQALQIQGYSFEDGGYAHQDMRQSYLASTRDRNGCQIIIEVDPVEGFEGKNELHLHSLGNSHYTHHEMRQRAKEINASLYQKGLQISAIQTQPSVYENEGLPIYSPGKRKHKQGQDSQHAVQRQSLSL